MQIPAGIEANGHAPYTPSVAPSCVPAGCPHMPHMYQQRARAEGSVARGQLCALLLRVGLHLRQGLGKRLKKGHACACAV